MGKINDSQVVVANGGPYSDNAVVPILDSFCLVPNCYTFKMYDSYGDGISSISCDPGSYTIKDKLGVTYSELLTSEANFGTLLSSPFCASLNINDPINAIKIYPNPTHSILKIVTNSLAFEHLTITSLTGQVIYEIGYFKNQTQIDVSTFSKGMYFVQLENSNEKVIRPIIID